MEHFAAKIINGKLIFNLLNSTQDLKFKFLESSKLSRFTKIEESSGKVLHQYSYFLQTDQSRKATKDIIIPKESDYNAVIVENRILPHTEFIIRNAIEKLDYRWSHTLVCNKKSYNKMLNFCKNINEKINVIAFEINEIDQASYNNLLLSREFWNFLKSEHLLIYQQDSIMFRDGIEEFLNYDYIGAPWMQGQSENSLGVGNGGFSLRKRSAMLRCLDKQKPQDCRQGDSVKQYMKSVGLNQIPEDVFFSKTLIDLNLGNVANSQIANGFSQERVPSKDPLGGHQYWLASMPIQLLGRKK